MLSGFEDIHVNHIKDNKVEKKWQLEGAILSVTLPRTATP